ncbi:transposase [Chromohalobacter japonicus]|uniref:transposase n=1 Tax=Chromohalobacter japonicus TaxID=223900 RepID=UPI001FF29B84|nr:transposase [Chromohalobacter japonicus]MCK0753984.1 transposase [Chromohalobacter japonicus]
MQAPSSPDCPECGSHAKRFPPGREGQYHVFCEDCGHDFGRYDHLVADYRHLLDDLEAHLGTSDNAPRDI